MIEKIEESAPLRAIDWRNSRLSKGVYCVEIEGIPYSNVYLASLDRKSRERGEQMVYSPSAVAWSITYGNAFLECSAELCLYGWDLSNFERCLSEIFKRNLRPAYAITKLRGSAVEKKPNYGRPEGQSPPPPRAVCC